MKRHSTFVLYFVIFTIIFSVFCIFFSLIINNGLISFSHGSNTYSDEYSAIIIDPGHGGKDSGAIGNRGVLEKDINLNIAYMLERMLFLSDIKVIMTRNEDVLLSQGESTRAKRNDIINRIRLSQNVPNGFLISIHQNKFDDSEYYGFQTFYSKNNVDSKLLATILQNNALSFIQNENKRQVKEADSSIMILDKLKIPSVLAECGFLSNYNEEALLNTPEYQRLLAFTIYISAMQFINHNSEVENEN